MSIEKKNFAGLQTFSISTLFSYFNAYQDSGFSEEEGFVISSLKEILNAGHSVRVRTDTDENTRTYELVHNAAIIVGLRELQESILGKSNSAVVVLDNHLFMATFRNDPVYSKVGQNKIDLKEQTLPKVVKIFSDKVEALVIPEIELTQFISTSIDNNSTLKIVSGISERKYSLEFKDSKKARNTLNRICKKYTSAKTI